MIAGLRVDARSHNALHIDEWWAAWLAIKFGSPEWLQANCRLDGETYILELGFGPGPFNEHPQKDDGEGNGRARIADESCATLVAKSLGLENAPLISRVMRYVKAQDLENKGSRLDLGNMLKQLASFGDWQNDLADDLTVGRWVFLAFDALYYAEVLRQSSVTLTPGVKRALDRPNPVMFSTLRLLVRLYCWNNPAKAHAWANVGRMILASDKVMFQDAVTAVQNTAEAVSLTINQRTYRICVMRRTRNPAVSRAFRRYTDPSKKWDMLVQFRPARRHANAKSVFITTAEGTKIPLREVAAVLRDKVFKAKVQHHMLQPADVPGQEMFRVEGDLLGCEEVYFFAAKPRQDKKPGSNGMIINGNVTNPTVPPLVHIGLLSERDVMDAVVTGLTRGLTRPTTSRRPAK
jgi:hypothetical protein